MSKCIRLFDSNYIGRLHDQKLKVKAWETQRFIQVQALEARQYLCLVCCWCLLLCNMIYLKGLPRTSFYTPRCGDGLEDKFSHQGSSVELYSFLETIIKVLRSLDSIVKASKLCAWEVAMVAIWGSSNGGEDQFK